MQEKKPELDDAAAADDTKIAQMVCSLTNREECMACGS
jgi:ribonucleoside-diphosphate reductase subunit M1